jgi:hypothetical protein
MASWGGQEPRAPGTRAAPEAPRRVWLREALERQFGIRPAFQNCHRVAAFRLDAGPAVHAEFTSTRSQVLNQSPQLRNC